MDKQKIGLIGALVIVAIALVGGIVLTVKGIDVPPWLAALLALVGWVLKSPMTPEQK